MPTAAQPTPFLQFAIVGVELKSLSYCDEELVRADATGGVEIVAEVGSNGSNWSGVAQSDSDSIGVVVYEIRKVNAPVNVASIIKNYSAQVFDNGDWVAHFRIEDEELVAAEWHGHLRTICSLPWRAERYVADRARLVDRESAQSGTAAGKESLAGGNICPGKTFGQAQAYAVGKNNSVHRLVICRLTKKAREVSARSKRAGNDSEVYGLKHAMMSVQWLVTSVLDDCS